MEVFDGGRKGTNAGIHFDHLWFATRVDGEMVFGCRMAWRQHIEIPI